MKIEKILPLEKKKPLIFVDNRERSSRVSEHLKKLDAEIREKHLEVGDYICSKRVGIERKTVSDFLSSITDKRLFDQLQNLNKSYNNPVLMIEGNPCSLFQERNMHENAIRGVLASIAIDQKIPIIWTADSKETAAQVYWIAYREQIHKSADVQIRSGKTPAGLQAQQEYLVSGLPGINSKRAKKLLKHFKTPEKIFSASEEKLKKLDGFGDKTAKKIKQILGKDLDSY